MSRILLDHGEGGGATSRLVRDVFLSRLGDPSGGALQDAAVLAGYPRLAFTTDTFVVRPLFFPGGDIGRLAIAGTVNDLAAMGARPRYLSAGFILEEGLEIAVLERVVDSMAATAAEAGIKIVTGDTKVVGRGEADGMFINTSGIGFVPDGRELSTRNVQPGDVVLVSGPVGDHGTAVLVAREGFGIEGDLRSDVAPLAGLAEALALEAPGLRCLRDPTRGGLATALVDIAHDAQVRVEIEERLVPVRAPARAACELLGLDPLYVACEGRYVVVVAPEDAPAALAALRAHPQGALAARIGQVLPRTAGPSLTLRTASGGLRPLIALEGAQLPRIC